MQDVKKNIEVNPSKEVAELIILEGKAKEPINKVKLLSVKGNLYTPIEYFNKRCKPDEEPVKSDGFNHAHDVCIFEFDYLERSITLRINHGEEFGSVTVTGKMIENPVFEQIGLNQPNRSYSSPQSLISALATRSDIFESVSYLRDLRTRMTNYSQKVTTLIDNFDDRQGKSRNSVQTDVQKLGSLDFILFAPLFSSESAIEIPVSVEVEVVDGKAKFYLISMEIEALKRDYIEKAMREYKDEIPLSIVVINK